MFRNVIGLPSRAGISEVEIAVHIGIEIELALLDQLHHRGPGRQLRNGAGTKQRGGRIDRLARRHVGVAIALLQRRRAIFPTTTTAPATSPVRQGVRQEAIEATLQASSRVNGLASEFCTSADVTSGAGAGGDDERSPARRRNSRKQQHRQQRDNRCAHTCPDPHRMILLMGRYYRLIGTS